MFINGYEDYERYENGGNAHAGWPDMWPEERHAEGALWQERKAMAEQYAMLQRYNQIRKPEAEANGIGKESVLVRALVSLARDAGWRIGNEWAIMYCNCNPVYVIPPEPEDDPRPTKWQDIVRWMDREKTAKEKREHENAERKEKLMQQLRRDNTISIDWSALTLMMEGMLPFAMAKPKSHIKKRRHFATRRQLQEYVCAQLAEETGWRRFRVTPTDERPIYRVL